MSDYTLLTDADKAVIAAEVAAAIPSPDDVTLAAEKAHYRRVLEAKIRGDMDGAAEVYVAPDTKYEVAALAVVDAEVSAVQVVKG